MMHTPIGNLGFHFQKKKLTRIDFLEEASVQTIPSQLQLELEAYFNNPRHQFKIDIELNGTPFQKKVWAAISNIPSGQIETYSSLAKKLKTGPRAVGNACRANPIPIIIPCHRVVAKNHLGGYAGNIKGKFFDIKTWLLRHEGIC